MGDEEEAPAGPKVFKCLMVVTSASEFLDGTPTGYYLSEVVHPYNEFLKHGWEVSFASVSGTATCDPGSVEAADAECLAFWEAEDKKALLAEPPALATIIEGGTATADYDAIYFVGGYGCAVDMPECAEAASLATAFFDAEKVVAAVCHGQMGLFAGETKLFADKLCTAFSNAEDEKMGKLEALKGGPGTCQDVMGAVAKFQVGTPFDSRVIVDGKLMTGGNPASAGPLATAVVYYYDAIKAEFEPPRLALLKERDALAAEMAEAEKTFVASLAALKADEAKGTAVGPKLDELQLKATSGKLYRSGILAQLDAQIERNAVRRQAALDAAAAAAAAAAEE